MPTFRVRYSNIRFCHTVGRGAFIVRAENSSAAILRAADILERNGMGFNTAITSVKRQRGGSRAV
jgi:hypothetical protein